MTLQVVFDKEKTESIMEVMPDVFSVWKVVLDNPVDRCFQAPYQGVSYKSGEQEAQIGKCNISYQLFYHFWVQKNFVLDRLNDRLEEFAEIYKEKLMSAEEIFHHMMGCRHPDGYRYEYGASIKKELEKFIYESRIGCPRVISCITSKEWVTALGKQYDGLAVVCRKAIFPVYPSNHVEPQMTLLIRDKSEKTRLCYNSSWIEKPVNTIRAEKVEPIENNETVMAMW